MDKTANIPYALLLEVYYSTWYRAYDDPQTFYTGERPHIVKLLEKLTEFVDPDDQNHQ
jgi:hypothetical protein